MGWPQRATKNSLVGSCAAWASPKSRRTQQPKIVARCCESLYQPGNHGKRKWDGFAGRCPGPLTGNLDLLATNFNGPIISLALSAPIRHHTSTPWQNQAQLPEIACTSIDLQGSRQRVQDDRCFERVEASRSMNRKQRSLPRDSQALRCPHARIPPQPQISTTAILPLSELGPPTRLGQ